MHVLNASKFYRYADYTVHSINQSNQNPACSPSLARPFLRAETSDKAILVGGSFLRGTASSPDI